MAFILRRPFTLSSTIGNGSRRTSKPLTSSWTASRAFHQPSPFRSSAETLSVFKTTSSVRTLSKAKDGLAQSFRRSYTRETYEIPRPDVGNLRQRLLYGAAIIGGTAVAVNLVFNRETREDGGMPAYERSYLNDTFMHTGLGIGLIAVAARALHQNGWSYRLMMANPWVVVGVGLAASVGSMYATFATPPEK